MKLSDAIMLGDTLKKCDPDNWISSDGSCGCALGGALLATGVNVKEFNEQWLASTFEEMPLVRSRWPWLTGGHVNAISDLYYDVANGTRTIEDVVSYVRSIEPAEPTISILPSRQPLVRIPEGSDQGDEQPEDLGGYPDPAENPYAGVKL